MRYEVEVKFHDDFIKVEENKIVVGLTSKPERGKANLELIKNLPNTSTYHQHRSK